MKKEVTIIGAGLVGSYLALRLRQLNFRVSVLEKRADPRIKSSDSGRSINLVVTSRGLKAFHEAGILQKVLDQGIPVYGREVHSSDGKTTFAPYGKGKYECNFSVSRLSLNILLMSEAEKAGAQLHFNKALGSVDWNENTLSFLDGDKQSFEVLLGCDGAGSQLRQQMGAAVESLKEDIGVDYKELFIDQKDNDYALEENSLHIWPAKKDNKPFMLMALANSEKTFTVTAFWPPERFAEIENELEAKSFFKEHFPSALPYLSLFPSDYMENPKSSLATLRCAPWSLNSKACLIGDSAHAIVPFFGQGLNLGLESASCFIRLLEQGDGDGWQALFENFFKARKANAEAIADMAIDNYIDMSSRSADPQFQMEKRIEEKIEEAFPEKYRSKYGLVTFTCQEYSKVKELGQLQRQFLREISKGLSSPEDLDLKATEKTIDENFLSFYEQHSIDLTSVNEKLLKDYRFTVSWGPLQNKV